MNQKTKLHTQKSLLYMLLAVSTLTCILLLLPIRGEEQIYSQTLRVHILASSNDPADQALKYHLRDELMPDISVLVAECKTVEEAENILRNNQTQITQTANAILEKAGCKEGVTTEIGDFRYDRRYLDGEIYPAGVYPSLRIVIGEGKGQNWWSVLFPSMSLYVSSNAGAEALTDPAYRFQTENVSFRFRTLEWLSSALEK